MSVTLFISYHISSDKYVVFFNFGMYKCCFSFGFPRESSISWSPPDYNALSSTIQDSFCNTFQDMLVFSNILSSPFVHHGKNGNLWVINGMNGVFCGSECSNMPRFVDMSSDDLRYVVAISEGCIHHGTHVLPLLGKRGTADAECAVKFTAIDQPHSSIHCSFKVQFAPPRY